VQFFSGQPVAGGTTAKFSPLSPDESEVGEEAHAAVAGNFSRASTFTGTTLPVEFDSPSRFDRRPQPAVPQWTAGFFVLRLEAEPPVHHPCWTLTRGRPGRLHAVVTAGPPERCGGFCVSFRRGPANRRCRLPDESAGAGYPSRPACRPDCLRATSFPQVRRLYSRRLTISNP